MEELIESYGELIRTLSRLANNNKELLLKSDIERLEKAKTILPRFAEGGAQWQRSSDESSNCNKPHVSSSLPQKCNCGQNCLPYDAVFTIKKCKRCGNDC